MGSCNVKLCRHVNTTLRCNTTGSQGVAIICVTGVNALMVGMVKPAPKRSMNVLTTPIVLIMPHVLTLLTTLSVAVHHFILVSGKK